MSTTTIKTYSSRRIIIFFIFISRNRVIFLGFLIKIQYWAIFRLNFSLIISYKFAFFKKGISSNIYRGRQILSSILRRRYILSSIYRRYIPSSILRKRWIFSSILKKRYILSSIYRRYIIFSILRRCIFSSIFSGRSCLLNSFLNSSSSLAQFYSYNLIFNNSFVSSRDIILFGIKILFKVNLRTKFNVD